MKIYTQGLLFAILATSCSKGQTPSSLNIINGKVAKVGDVPGVVGFYTDAAISEDEWTFFCTGTKVGPKAFLTAAHCIDAGAEPGDNLGNLQLRDIDAYVEASVERVAVHPDYIASADTLIHGPDIALIFVNEETPNIPIVEIAKDIVPPATKAMIAGYGCEFGRDSKQNETIPPRLKFGHVELLTAENFRANLAISGSSEISDAAIRASFDTYYYNEGPVGVSNNKQMDSTCPGDSGSALRTADKSKIIGITSFGVNAFAQKNSSAKLPIFNGFTKIFEGGLYNTYGWIKAELRDERVDLPLLSRSTHVVHPDDSEIVLSADDLRLPASIQGVEPTLLGAGSYRNDKSEYREPCVTSVQEIWAKKSGAADFEKLNTVGDQGFVWADAGQHSVSEVKVVVESGKFSSLCLLELKKI